LISVQENEVVLLTDFGQRSCFIERKNLVTTKHFGGPEVVFFAKAYTKRDLPAIFFGKQ
jgi:hypothetical protein